MAASDGLAERYRAVTERIGEAAARGGRSASDVICVAVTKYASPDQIRKLVELGHADLGENRVQPFEQRVAMIDEFLSRHRLMPKRDGSSVPERVRWHMVGHLQRNKVKAVLPLATLIHSVDSLRLAEEIEQRATQLDRTADVLLQVNASGEQSKHGLAPPAVPHMAEQMAEMSHVRVRGLMTMAPYADDPEASRPIFQRTAELFYDMKGSGRFGEPFNLLSMGMSNDYTVAIECGANLVRIGRSIFGEQPAAKTG